MYKMKMMSQISVTDWLTDELQEMLKLLFTTKNISESHELHLLTEDEGVLLGDVDLGLEQETALGRDMRGEI